MRLLEHLTLSFPQHYAIKFVSNLRQVGGFLPGTPVSSTNKTDRHDIPGILLKVALNIITLALTLDINLYLLAPLYL
jgi:hypothetical protein